MAGKPFCPSIALLRSLNRIPSPPQCLRRTALRHQRPLHTSRILAKEPQSFHGQLYESTAERVKKERAEQQRFAEARGENTKGRSAAVTAGNVNVNPAYAPQKVLTSISRHRNWNTSILGWLEEISSSSTRIHFTTGSHSGATSQYRQSKPSGRVV
ncbi:MAG: hypothetical protein Q9204_006903 [Flavoplaca sp. TL-2023a]